MRRTLPTSFFRKKATDIAPALLGKCLVRSMRRATVSAMITEVEAYDGLDDLASHASRGRTPRSAVMFGPPGHWYVYLVYGIHEMLNIVCGPEGYPAAVLIRGVHISPRTSLPPRPQNYQGPSLVRGGGRVRAGEIAGEILGPGRVTKELAVTRALNGQPATAASGLWIEDRGVRVRRSEIIRTSRIGVAYAGEWAHKPWRFTLQ
ncbi:3-methyladenine DNA glycosylase [Candidatus Kaiserbacteria bacterium CG10_big_fil_rev_8_21_14_0_10_59_10]|uniref:Putative 3-methyladenine DNA glycosylase n=1 Tax=Candidatus Kaiserbacteria bacterium CG10_big_fil_rev_8_21_14_0_10_59_10 TaxID=1974612 RepID=A0A2H0U722_9BACT|nr:MAG: 3-methyladenine DNA glycosylase [Candidatus Kaiserbacteria bacterium CG10_big_fil_rev_8_21_14_0_10_59_10]